MGTMVYHYLSGWLERKKRTATWFRSHVWLRSTCRTSTLLNSAIIEVLPAPQCSWLSRNQGRKELQVGTLSHLDWPEVILCTLPQLSSRSYRAGRTVSLRTILRNERTRWEDAWIDGHDELVLQEFSTCFLFQLYEYCGISGIFLRQLETFVLASVI